MIRQRIAAAVVAAVALVGSATAIATANSPTAQAAASVPVFDHIVLVMFENHAYSQLNGSSSAPYFNSLAGQGAKFTQSYGVTHPSEPNYLAIFSGSTQGVTDDSCPHTYSGNNLGKQLIAAGKTFKGYSESMPSDGYTGCSSGQYRRKHNGWVNFSSVPAASNLRYSNFPSSANYASLPTVSFVTPNMCNDMHDCSVATGDAWLKTQFARYADWATTHNSLLVVTFDENDGGTVNQIATVLVGANVRPGLNAERMDHYTLLRTLEDAYGLAPLGRAAAATPLQSVWTGGPSAPTPTPPAPAPTPPPTPAGVQNGGFESSLDGWVLSNSTYSSEHHHYQGSRSGRAGSTSPTQGDSILSQTFTVPADKTQLSVWWEGFCSDTVDKAWASAFVKSNTTGALSTLLPPTCVAGGGWRPARTPVTPGQSYTVQLVNHDDGSVSTVNRTYFDDVTLS